MKRIICFLLTLLLAFGLCACSAGDSVLQENAEYYILSRYVLQSTGDVNVSSYDYDENWDLMKTETLLNGNFASAVDYTYSEDKSRVTMDYSSAVYEPHSTEVQREFDAEGRIIKDESYENGALVSTSEYVYDAEDRVIKTLTSYPDGPTISMERSYDKNGKLICQNTDTGYSTSRQDYSYDAKGRLISERYYQNDVLQNYVEYTNEGSTRYGSVCDADGNVQSKLMEVLDEAGNVLESERRDVSGNVISYSCFVYACSDGRVSGELPE